MLNRKAGALYDNFSQSELEALYIGLLATKTIASSLLKVSENLPIFTSLEKNLNDALNYAKN